MKVSLAVILLIVPLVTGQIPDDSEAVAELARMLKLPLQQRMNERESHKIPALAAYRRQVALDGHDCETVTSPQHDYNVCMFNAAMEADKDFAVFYANLEMLMGAEDDFRRLQETQNLWLTYRTKAADAAQARYGQGTNGPSEYQAAWLTITRDRMRELYRIYSLNFSQ